MCGIQLNLLNLQGLYMNPLFQWLKSCVDNFLAVEEKNGRRNARVYNPKNYMYLNFNDTVGCSSRCSSKLA